MKQTAFAMRPHVPLLALVALLILLGAFGLRLGDIERESIWHDEGWSIRAIRSPFGEPDDNTPFGYYALMHLLWWGGAGESALALRYGSVLLGVIGIGAAMRLAGRWFGGSVGLATGALLAVNPLLWAYAREVRAYILVPLLATVLLWAAEKMLTQSPSSSNRRGGWRMLLLVAGLEAAALYTHNLGVPLVAWVNTAVIAALFSRRAWRWLAGWLGTQAVVAFVYLPWLLTQTPSGTPLNTPPQLGMSLIGDIWYSYFLPVLPQLREAGSLPLLDGLGIVAVIGGMALMISYWRSAIPLSPLMKRGRNNLRWGLLVSQVVLIPAFTVGLIVAARIDFHPRYFVAAVPATMLLTAAISFQASGFSRPRFKAGNVKLKAGHVLLVMVVIWAGTVGLWSINAVGTQRAYQHDDFAGLAGYYATLPAESVILMPFGTEPALQSYFAGRLGIEARFVNLPLYSDEAVALAAINQLAESGVKQVEFLTWFQLPADERGMYPCLLTAASTAVDAPRTFYGLMTQAYRLEKAVELLPLTLEPRYANAQLREADYAASPAGICLRTGWHGTGEAAQVQMALLNPLGGEIARSDATIAPADPLNPGDRAAYNLLHLPEAAPELDYELALTLYSPSQPNGYDLLSVEGNPTGKIYRQAQAVRAAGPPYSGDERALPLLLGDNTGEARILESGQSLDVTVLVPGGVFNASVRLVGDSWSTDYGVNSPDGPLLTWTRFSTQAGTAGNMTLYFDETELAQYQLVNIARLFTPPQYVIPVGIDFPGVGRLEGTTITRQDTSLAVMLVWKAEETPSVPYTVFVQAFDAAGNMLAQSDRMPVEGTRPTSGWVAGEYIVDYHWLKLPDGNEAAYLIAGFYDAGAAGFPRVATREGGDHAGIPLSAP